MLDRVDVGDHAVVEPLVVGGGGGHARDDRADPARRAAAIHAVRSAITFGTVTRRRPYAGGRRLSASSDGFGPPRLGLLGHPAVDRLELGGQRDQQRLAVGRAHQLHADRQPVGGEPGGDVDRRPAQQIPRPGRRAGADHGAVGGQAAALVEVVHRRRRLRGRRRQNTSTRLKIVPDAALRRGFAGAGPAQHVLRQQPAHPHVADGARVERDVVAEAVRPLQQARRRPGQEVPRHAAACSRDRRPRWCARVRSSCSPTASQRGPDLGVQLGAERR